MSYRATMEASDDGVLSGSDKGSNRGSVVKSDNEEEELIMGFQSPHGGKFFPFSSCPQSPVP